MAQSAAATRRDANERQVVNAFRVHRALTPKTALTLHTLGLGDSDTVRVMLAAGTIRHAGPARYYLDEGQLASQRQVSGSTVFRIALGITAVATAVALYRFL